MDLKSQIIYEYLTQQVGYRQLENKYGIAKSIICRWVVDHQDVHNLPPTDKQRKHYFRPMKGSKTKASREQQQDSDSLQEKIAALEKQLKLERLRADALDMMINVAEKQLNISIRKKSGNPQSKK
jgi:transposase-like protein